MPRAPSSATSAPAGTGELLLDWTGTGQDIRIFGTNAHHDVTWTAGTSGAVTGSVRYDPAGTATSVTGSVPDFRFQGSWADDTTKLSWVVTRWYAPAQGRFLSEDSLLGDQRDPDSRHLYAYGAGDPVGAWDPDGRYWYRIRSGDTAWGVAASRLGKGTRWPMIINANRSTHRIPSTYKLVAGRCIWIPLKWVLWGPDHHANVNCPVAAEPTSSVKAYAESRLSNTSDAAYIMYGGSFLNLTRERLISLTKYWTGRGIDISYGDIDDTAMSVYNGYATDKVHDKRGEIRPYRQTYGFMADVQFVYGNTAWPSEFPGAIAFTMGYYIFVGPNIAYPPPKWLISHEYVHVLEFEGLGWGILNYANHAILAGERGTPENPYEAIAYLWEGWTRAFGEASFDVFWRPSP